MREALHRKAKAAGLPLTQFLARVGEVEEGQAGERSSSRGERRSSRKSLSGEAPRGAGERTASAGAGTSAVEAGSTIEATAVASPAKRASAAGLESRPRVEPAPDSNARGEEGTEFPGDAAPGEAGAGPLAPASPTCPICKREVPDKGYKGRRHAPVCPRYDVKVS